jgi:hypothetical protein
MLQANAADLQSASGIRYQRASANFNNIQAQNALSALKNAGYARSGIGLGLKGAGSHFFNPNGTPKTAGATP